MLVYLGNLLVYLYLVNLSTKEFVVSNAMRDEIVHWRGNSLKGIKFIAQWQATEGAAPWGSREECYAVCVRGGQDLKDFKDLNNLRDLTFLPSLPSSNFFLKFQIIIDVTLRLITI